MHKNAAFKQEKPRGVFLAIPLHRNPRCIPFFSSVKRAVKRLRFHGYEVFSGLVLNDSFVQRARNRLVKQFLDSPAETMVFLDDDMSWEAADIVRLLSTPGEIVAGMYPLKIDGKEMYPGCLNFDKAGYPIARDDGCLSSWGTMTGFMKIERSVFETLIKTYPEQMYCARINDEPTEIYYDFFPQGVCSQRWWGEDYSFCRLWTQTGGKIWILPDIDFVHYGLNKAYHGNYHKFLKRLPGGIDSGNSK